MSVLTSEFQGQAFAHGSFLRVVNWHNTPQAARHTLRAELSWYAGRYQPVLADDLDRLFDTGVWAGSKPGFIPVFYDSYRNNATVAAPVCDELGLTAWFFVPTAILSVPPEEQQEYARAHDMTQVEEERSQQQVAMTWDDVARISERHVVAAHTANHTAAVDVVSEADIEREVLGPIRMIEQVTGRRPPAFAWLYGTAFDPQSVACRAVRDAGVRYHVSNTVYQRIGD